MAEYRFLSFQRELEHYARLAEADAASATAARGAERQEPAAASEPTVTPR